jgi:hypothetical protein
VKWRKLGRLFVPDGTQEWMDTHAAAPVVMPLGGSSFRVYCTGRDAKNRSRIGYVEFDLDRPAASLRVSDRAVLLPGKLGAFDDSGVTSACLVRNNGKHYLYYTGWNVGSTVPFHLEVGLAISEDGGQTFERISDGPVLGRNRVDPYLVASPSILVENGVWRAWYVAGLKWELDGGIPKHYYHIRYAESDDGIDWRRDGRVCVDFAAPDEHAFGRPMVYRVGGGYEMWYAYRGARYLIGYAESPDGLTWTRRDADAGIVRSESGWDSEMLEYPCLFEHNGRRYMLYNGNEYGKTGFGLAVLEN